MPNLRSLRSSVVALAAVVVSILLASCGGAPAPSSPASANTPSNLRIAMVMIGSSADGGWNSAGTEGLRQLRDKFGADIDYKELDAHDNWEEVTPPDWTAALSDYAKRGYGLIFAHGRRFDKVVTEVAPKYPDTRFVVTGGTVSGPNYSSTTLKNEEAGYVLGVLAGSMTKTNVIGAIASSQIQPHLSTVEAFKLGVKAANPKAQVMEEVLNDNGSGDEDVTAETNAASKMIDSKADIIFIRASSASVSVIKLAQQHKIFVINYAKDLTNVAPKTVLANGLQITPMMMQRMTEIYKDGTFTGKNYILGLADGAVKLSPLRAELVPEDVRARVAQAQQDVIDGKIKLEVAR